MIFCRWGPDGEYLSIATAGAILGPCGAIAPDAIAPIHSLFGVLVSETEKEATSTFLLVRQLPIPIELAGTFFPADGYVLLQQRETINLVCKRVNRDLKVGGVVLCLYDAGTRLGGEVIDDLDQYFDGRKHANAPWAEAKVFRTRIRRNIRLAECPSFGQSIFQYAPTSRGAEDYASLAGEVQGRPPASIWLTPEKRVADEPHSLAS